MRVAPLLLIAVGLIVVFKAGIWNLGIDGQFLLAAAVIAGIGPTARASPAERVNLIVLFLIARRRRRCLDDPARAAQGALRLNEIITTLMMTFIGINLAAILVKGPFQDPSTTIPQTGRSTSVRCCRRSRAPIASRRWPGIHVGLLVALAAAVVVWYLMPQHLVRPPPGRAGRLGAVGRATWASTCRG